MTQWPDNAFGTWRVIEREQPENAEISIRTARIEILSSSDTPNTSARLRRSNRAVEKTANPAASDDASATNRQFLSVLRYSLDESGFASGAFKEWPKASVS